MNFKSIKNAVTSKVGRQALIAQKHSPKLLFVAGVVGVGATVILACRATLKVEEVLEEHEKLSMMIDSVNLGEEYTEQDRQKDTVLLYTKTFGKLVKLYGPSVVTGVVSIAALTGAHVVLSRRNTGLVAAYAAVERGYAAYRKRVEEEFGPEKEREIRLGLVDKEIVEETEEGPVVKTIKAANENSGGLYKFCYDEVSSTNWDSSPGYNQVFLRSQQNWANDLLLSRGHVFLNDVLDMLGLRRCPQGAVVGWIKDSETGDGYIDFGVFDGDTYMGMEFVKGNENAVWLNFNVDGTIWDKI